MFNDNSVGDGYDHEVCDDDHDDHDYGNYEYMMMINTMMVVAGTIEFLNSVSWL